MITKEWEVGGQPTGVSEKVLDRDLAAIVTDPLREPTAHRIVEGKLGPLQRSHDERCRRHDLCQRGEVEQAVEAGWWTRPVRDSVPRTLPPTGRRPGCPPRPRLQGTQTPGPRARPAGQSSSDSWRYRVLTQESPGDPAEAHRDEGADEDIPLPRHVGQKSQPDQKPSPHSGCRSEEQTRGGSRSWPGEILRATVRA